MTPTRHTAGSPQQSSVRQRVVDSKSAAYASAVSISSSRPVRPRSTSAGSTASGIKAIAASRLPRLCSIVAVMSATFTAATRPNIALTLVDVILGRREDTRVTMRGGDHYVGAGISQLPVGPLDTGLPRRNPGVHQFPFGHHDDHRRVEGPRVASSAGGRSTRRSGAPAARRCQMLNRALRQLRLGVERRPLSFETSACAASVASFVGVLAAAWSAVAVDAGWRGTGGWNTATSASAIAPARAQADRINSGLTVALALK